MLVDVQGWWGGSETEPAVASKVDQRQRARATQLQASRADGTLGGYWESSASRAYVDAASDKSLAWGGRLWRLVLVVVEVVPGGTEREQGLRLSP